MRPVVWISEPLLRRCERLSSGFNVVSGGIIVSTAEQFLKATRDPKTVAFVDSMALAILATIDQPLVNPIVALCEESLQTAISWLEPYPWLSHVVSAAMLDHPMAAEHVDNVMRTLTDDGEPRLLDWLEPSVAGRRIRMTHASKRVARLERMTEFFRSKNVGARTLELLQNVAEELLTNAFYDAPVAAGAMKKPVSRTQDIALPDDSACDLAYGCREDLAIVRVQDPFGSLSRQRLVEVLTRCAAPDMQVKVDESMGGAGLGMWRIFSAASFVAISVSKDRHTEFLVGIAKRASAGPKPFAFHFFFRDSGTRRSWRIADEETSRPSINKSVMIVSTKSK